MSLCIQIITLQHWIVRTVFRFWTNSLEDEFLPHDEWHHKRSPLLERGFFRTSGRRDELPEAYTPPPHPAGSFPTQDNSEFGQQSKLHY